MSTQPLSRNELADLIESQAASFAAALRKAGQQVTSRPSVRLAPWVKTVEKEGESYSWPQGVEHYSPFEVWESVTVDGDVRVGLGRVTASQLLYGRERFWWLAFEMIGDEKGRPIVVFNEADVQGDASDGDGDLVAVIKGKGKRGRSMFAPGDDLPDGYEELPIAVFRDKVLGPQAPNRLAVVASGGDRDVMLDHALLQLRLRA